MAVRVVAGAPHARRQLPLALIAAVLVAGVTGVALGRATAPNGASTPPAAARPSDGPARVVGGVPIGFAHTRAGAVAALSSASALLSEPNTLLDRSRRAQILRLVATPRYAATFGGQAGAALEASARALPPVYFSVPVAYRILRYDADTATVQGWGVAVTGGTSGPPQATWGTSVTTARWSGNDWKVDSSHTTPGPTPALAPGAEPSPGGAFLDALRSAHGIRHVP